MPDTTDILGLPLILPAQAQKHVTHNEALLLLDVAVQLAVIDRNRSAPPSLPALGDCHIVAAAASLDWAGQSGTLAVQTEAGWQFHAPRPGWRAYIRAEAQIAVFDGSVWLTPSQGEGRFALLSLGTSADATNRLAVAAPAVLMTHVGAGMQLKLNKAAAVDTASLLYQTNWSGRAEIGTAGGDDFAVKVSADGGSWRTGLQIAAASGIVQCPEGLEASSLTRGGSPVVSRDSLLGAVSHSAGLPTGAVIEHGTSANGDYMRLADGTQICWSAGLSLADVASATGAGFGSGLVSWTYPSAFASGSTPVVTGHTEDSGCWLAVAAPTTSAVSLRGLSFVSRATALPLRVMAIGRWF